MATETDEVTLDIDALDAAAGKKPEKTADTPTEVVVEPEVVAKTADKAVVTTDEAVAKLKTQLENEKNARLAAEARAREAVNGEAAARGQVQQSQLDQIKGAIEQAQAKGDALEQQYAAAMAAQDFPTVAKLQREMSRNEARREQLEAGKIHLENAPKPVPRPVSDPVEKFVEKMSPQSASWIRSHPEFVTDPRKNRLMIRAHEDALDAGLAPDTPAYFRSVEMTLGLQSPVTGTDSARRNGHDTTATVEVDPTADASASVATGGRSASPAAAPVSRSGSAGTSRAGTVKLSPAEVEMAQNMFGDMKDAKGNPVDPLAEYARNKIALKKEGKL
jgi:hypothetical protein